MIIDFHVHILPAYIRDNYKEYIDRDACFSLLYSRPPVKISTAEELITSMDKSGIDKSVVLNIGWMSHEMCVETNNYILEAVSKYPERLIAFCAIQPGAREKALKELERCARNGARGIGELRPDTQGFALTDEVIMKPVVQEMMKSKLIFLTHSSEPVGHQYPGKGTITPEVIYPFVTMFSELRIVLAHWGGGLPFYSLMPEVAKTMSNVFYDSAATVFLYRPQIFEVVSRIAGSDKILFGSDWPLLSQDRIIDQLLAAELSQNDKENILSNNAAALLAYGE